jgi:tetratricopeptide (TPR) repeat protein
VPPRAQKDPYPSTAEFVRRLFHALLFLVGACLGAEPAGVESPRPIALDGAISAYRSRQYDEAEAKLRTLKAEHPANGEIVFYLGQIARRRARWDEAVIWYEDAIRLDPVKATYWLELGGVFGAKAKAEASAIWAAKSLQALEKAVELAPGDFETRAGLADFYRQAPSFAGGGIDKAYAQAHALRDLNPSGGTRLLASLLIRERRFTEAAAACRLALEKLPEDYAALYYAGQAAALSGQDLEHGRDSLKKCLTLPAPPGLPGPSTVWCRLAQLELKNGRQPEAKAAYEEALKIDPNNKEARDGLAGM